MQTLLRPGPSLLCRRAGRGARVRARPGGLRRSVQGQRAAGGGAGGAAAGPAAGGTLQRCSGGGSRCRRQRSGVACGGWRRCSGGTWRLHTLQRRRRAAGAGGGDDGPRWGRGEWAVCVWGGGGASCSRLCDLNWPPASGKGASPMQVEGSSVARRAATRPPALPTAPTTRPCRHPPKAGGAGGVAGPVRAGGGGLPRLRPCPLQLGWVGGGVCVCGVCVCGGGASPEVPACGETRENDTVVVLCERHL